MGKNYLKLGDWNALCDVCGFKYKASELIKRWDGHMVCKYDYETRHPMDFFKAPAEERIPSWTRPEPTDLFLNTDDFWLTETGEYIVDQLELPFFT